MIRAGLQRVATVPIDATHQTRVLAGNDGTLLVHECWRTDLGAFALLALEHVTLWQPIPTGALGAAILDARQVSGATR